MAKGLKQPIILGVTGQLGTGKSTVSAMFAELGAVVVNADLLANRSIRSGKPGFEKVLRVFGKDILNQGQIDRKKLAEIVFPPQADAGAKLKELEKIIHPLVIAETKKEIATLTRAGKKMIVLDVPLLFESGMDKLVDITLVVQANAKIRLQRILKDGRLTGEAVKQRGGLQLSMTEKIRRADLVVDNNASIEKTRSQVNQIWKMLKREFNR